MAAIQIWAAVMSHMDYCKDFLTGLPLSSFSLHNPVSNCHQSSAYNMLQILSLFSSRISNLKCSLELPTKCYPFFSSSFYLISFSLLLLLFTQFQPHWSPCYSLSVSETISALTGLLFPQIATWLNLSLSLLSSFCSVVSFSVRSTLVIIF